MAEDGKTPIIMVTKENRSVKGNIEVFKIGEQLVGQKPMNRKHSICV